MTTEHDVIYLEPLEEYYGWEGRGWSTEDYYADIRNKPGVPFLLATPKRLAADDLYAALEVFVANEERTAGDEQGYASDSTILVAARIALSKARSEPLPLQRVE